MQRKKEATLHQLRRLKQRRLIGTQALTFKGDDALRTKHYKYLKLNAEQFIEQPFLFSYQSQKSENIQTLITATIVSYEMLSHSVQLKEPSNNLWPSLFNRTIAFKSVRLIKWQRCLRGDGADNFIKREAAVAGVGMRVEGARNSDNDAVTKPGKQATYHSNKLQNSFNCYNGLRTAMTGRRWGSKRLPSGPTSVTHHTPATDVWTIQNDAVLITTSSGITKAQWSQCKKLISPPLSQRSN